MVADIQPIGSAMWGGRRADGTYPQGEDADEARGRLCRPPALLLLVRRPHMLVVPLVLLLLAPAISVPFRYQENFWSTVLPKLVLKGWQPNQIVQPTL